MKFKQYKLYYLNIMNESFILGFFFGFLCVVSFYTILFAIYIK